MWDLMIQIDRKKEIGETYRPRIEQLNKIVLRVIDEVIFPFHKSFFNLYPSAITIHPFDRYWSSYFEELHKNLRSLRNAGLITAPQEKEYKNLFRGAWERILRDVKGAPIHGDLMWRQILVTKEDKLVVIDLDEHAMGHAGKDIADLCAANRFMVEDIPCHHKELVRNLAEKLNKLMIKRYLENVRKVKAAWGERLEETVTVYLALRHLHDMAYHLPIWREATNSVVKKRHWRYVTFSLDCFREEVEKIKKLRKLGAE